jgi:hypothetical protein
MHIDFEIYVQNIQNKHNFFKMQMFVYTVLSTASVHVHVLSILSYLSLPSFRVKELFDLELKSQSGGTYWELSRFLIVNFL